MIVGVCVDFSLHSHFYRSLNTFLLYMYIQRNCHQRSVSKINVLMEALALSTEMAIDVVAQQDLLEILVKLKVIFHITLHHLIDA